MNNLISIPRSIIPSCDVSNMGDYENLIKQTYDIPGIGGYKVGLELTILYGLKALVDIAREYTPLPVIYDHQKGGTDIPELGIKFAKVCRSTGVHAVILFPFGGMATEIDWIKACHGEGVAVIVGGHMTQREFLQSEGGFIANDGPMRIYEIAVKAGISDFVVPGNKPELILKYRELFDRLGNSPTLYAPGFVAQGGVISECGKVAGNRWHAIVGSGIYKAKDIREAARTMTKQLLS